MILDLKGLVPAGEYGRFVRAQDEGWNAVYQDKTVFVEQEYRFNPMRLDEYRLQGLENGKARIIRFADLHCHSHKSLMDSISKISDLAELTEYAGALTDHGNMYGFLEHYQAMRKRGKKPIIGIEAYMTDLDGGLTRNHVILLAKNLTGCRNLWKLSSLSFEQENMKADRPHVTWDMLEQYHEGIICLSACISGLIPRLLMKEDQEGAEKAVRRFLDIFGDDFYIEIQNHHFERESRVRPALVELAGKFDVKIVATSDSHYIRPEDKEAHTAVICLDRGKKLYDGPDQGYEGDGYWLMSSEEMEERFEDYPQALDTSLEIADKCDVEIPLGDVNLPKYDIPAPFASPADYMEHLTREGLKQRFEDTPHLGDPVYLDRLNYELDMIKQMGFPSYFIIVWDFINWARNHNIYVGPGRGSAAGSLVAYCMGITDVDPVRYNLLFERFLNPERVSYPDIDTDIEDTGRPLVMQYLRNKYGEENVCRIITFGSFGPRRAILDMAKVLGYPTSFGVNLVKYIPKRPDITIKEAIAESYELKVAYETDVGSKRVIDLAMKIEGNSRNTSVHACGVAIAPSAISNYLPTAYAIDSHTGERCRVSQVEKEEVEPLSLIKMDLLGLQNLGAIHVTLDKVVSLYGKDTVLEQFHSTGPEVRYQDIPLGDRATYEMLRSGNTGGVFQYEGEGITGVLKDVLYDLPRMTDEELDQGKAFERLVAANALYRPGPIDCIPEYIRGLRDPSQVHYDCPEEETLLSSTYGVMVYQEQLMHIAQKLAGYTLGRADVIRKGAAKKKKEVLNKEHPVFVHGNKKEYESGKDKNLAPGCVANGIPEKTAERIWDKMEKFGRYAFNRSHSVCYAWIGYLTAYLKCHYPKEFYAAMLTAFLEDSDKRRKYLAQVNRMGIKILPPDVQTSRCEFTVEGDAIRFGLQGISGLKSRAVSIVLEREKNGAFKDFQDFYTRLTEAGAKPDKTNMEGLAYSGALQCFSDNKAALIAYSKVLDDDQKKKDAMVPGQMSLFIGDLEKIPMPDTPRMSASKELEKEHEVLGIFLSRHPTDDYTDKLGQRKDYMPLDMLAEMTERRKAVKTMGLIQNLNVFNTKKNQTMASFLLSSKFSEVKCVVFPTAMDRVKSLLLDNAVVCLKGDWIEDRNHEEEMQFSVEDILLPGSGDGQYENLNVPLQGIVVDVDNREEQEAVRAFVREHPGQGVVILRAKGCDFTLKQRVDVSSFETMLGLFRSRLM